MILIQMATLIEKSGKGNRILKSIWKQDVTLMSQKPLQNNMSVQAVVIGGGLSGILTAYFLQKKGIKVIVLEAERIAGGQTQNTTAKISSQHGLFYADALRKIGKQKARIYAMANERAVEQYEKLIETEKISCRFTRLPSYLYTTENAGIEILQKEAEAAALLGIRAQYVSGECITELPFAVCGAVKFLNQAQFHPLEFIKPLCEQLVIYENTRVLSVKGHTVYTDSRQIEADYIVFATHYPFVNIPGFYFLRQHQERSYVLALRGQKELTGMYYSMDEDGLSFRSMGHYLLLGGGKHRTGKKISCTDEKYGYSFLKKMAQNYYPQAEIAFAWSAQDCMPHDEVPFIGRYSVFRPYWYVATGFKKWGMTSSMIAAQMISGQIYEDAIKGVCSKTNEEVSGYTDVFSPQRFFFRASIKNLVIDVGESILGLSKGLFAKAERRCTHMGCRVEWNPEENSWDCPCHGSRFAYEGKLKDNPAQTDLHSFHNGV